MANTNERNTLLFLSEDDVKTVIDALIFAFRNMDIRARSMESGWDQRGQEIEQLKAKLEAADGKLAVMDAAYADLDDERAAWKEKYDRLVASMSKKLEQEGK